MVSEAIAFSNTSQAHALEHAILGKTAKVGVIGLGYVGLPLVQSVVAAGFSVLGFDTDRAKISHLRGGESYLGHVPGEAIEIWLKQQRFEPTLDLERLSEPDVLLICVPTPLNEARDPDISHLVATAKQIAMSLRPGQLIVLESTTYPGTTREFMLPILEGSGLSVSEDFFLAYSPEREDPGNRQFSVGTIPKVVGGIDSASLQLAKRFYRHIAPSVVPVSSCEVAEASKILENTYRAVNIALVNELKVLFERMAIDIWEVIAAAQTKPFGFQAFYPGPGLGGHCIPVDPFYLSWLARKFSIPTRFIELAGEVNTMMPHYVYGRVVEALNARGKALRANKILLLGVAYKKDVDDPRESPAFVLLERLQAAGAQLSYNDPHIPKLPTMRNYRVPDLQSSPLTADILAQQDCVLIVTDHSAYDFEFIVRHAQLVVDTRNATRHVREGRERIWKA